jgi:hypothetical protein
MPDITMCRGGDCPDQHKCYRARAIPSEYADQSYFLSPPFQYVGCEYFQSLIAGDHITYIRNPDNC